MLSVLHLWKSDSSLRGAGGGGSMLRLHKNLLRAGVNSQILCELKDSGLDSVQTLPGNSRLDNALRKITSPMGLNDIHKISSFFIKRHQAYKQAKIINFHGFHHGFINYLALPALTAEKTAIFTLRDMWAFTGHCACNYDCNKWMDGCGSCPYLYAPPSIKRDATHLEWKLKKWAYEHSKLIIVGISNYMVNMAKKTPLNRFPMYCIPNGIDIQDYTPLEKEVCRKALGIAEDLKVIMCCAGNLESYHKGVDLLIAALSALPEKFKKEVLLLLVGLNGTKIIRNLEIKHLHLGFLNNERLKSIAYSAADIFVHPVRNEALGNVILESMSCGTPVVAFSVGGIPDLVRHKQTGLLSKPEDHEMLSKNILCLLKEDVLRNKMGSICRKMVEKEYEASKETNKYIDLYSNSILKN